MAHKAFMNKEEDELERQASEDQLTLHLAGNISGSYKLLPHSGPLNVGTES